MSSTVGVLREAALTCDAVSAAPLAAAVLKKLRLVSMLLILNLPVFQIDIHHINIGSK